MIELENVSKSFGSVRALDRLSLRVQSGELFSFLGPNGAGKTTTVKLIAGLSSPDSGQIRVNGVDIGNDPVAAKRSTGYVPDIPFLYEKLSGLEFLQFTGSLYEMSSQEISREIDSYCQKLEMGEWIFKPVEGYSHGMKQRVVFTSAFLHSPQVLVIDEPMVGLDPKSAHVIKQLLKAKSHSGVTVFLSTHNLNVAEELSDRIAIIDRGKLLWVGTIDGLRESTRKGGNLEELFLRIVQEGTPGNGHHAFTEDTF